MTDRELLKATLKILDKARWVSTQTSCEKPQKVVLQFQSKDWFQMTKAISDRLAQPEPEPVAWRNKDPKGCWQYRNLPILTDGQPLYTAPPQREWQGLTDDEVQEFLDNRAMSEWCGAGHVHLLPYTFARAIEAKLKEKNT
jgi:hypothetical protein